MFGQPFALLNDVEHDALIYGKRPAGINLIWLKDYGKSTFDRIAGGVKGYVKGRAGDWLKTYLGKY